MPAIQISITELKSRFDFYLEQVKVGRAFMITRYGKPFAYFAPELTQVEGGKTVESKSLSKGKRKRS